MDCVWGDVLGPPHDTTPAAVFTNAIYELDPLEAVKTFERKFVGIHMLCRNYE